MGFWGGFLMVVLLLWVLGEVKIRITSHGFLLKISDLFEIATGVYAKQPRLVEETTRADEDDEAEKAEGDIPHVEKGFGSFAAQSVKVLLLPADVVVRVHDGPDCWADVNGRKDLVDAIRVELTDGQLKLTADIDGYECDEDEFPTVNLQVPRGISLHVEAEDGSIDVDDVGGPISVVQQGDEDVVIGKVGEARLVSHGDGRIEVSQVSKKLAVEVTGNGEVEVNDGTVDELTISVRGGRASFGGTALNANLTSYAGSIDVANVLETPMVQKQSIYGSIRVGNKR